MSIDTDTTPLILRKLRPRAGARRDEEVAVAVAPGEATAYARAALAEEVATMSQAPEGVRNDTLNRCGFNLSQLVAAQHLSHDQAWNALHAAALATGLAEGEVVQTLRSAFRAGQARPRIVAAADPADAPEVHTITAPEQAANVNDDADLAQSLRDRFPALNWRELWADESREEWLIEPLIPARRLVALFSAPKVGKSLLMLELAVNIARGTEVLGYRPDRPHRVLYVDFENDPRGDVRSRLQAMGVGPDDLTGLVYLSYPRLAHLDTNVGGLELLAVAQLYGVDLVVIDTISRAVGGEENDNDTWLGFYRNTGLHLKAAGIAVIRLDHTGKDATKGMRGGSAKYGDVDAVWSLTRLGEDKFRLECTDARLPIVEKLLTINRQQVPLRHTLDTAGLAVQYAELEAAAARHLDTAGYPEDGGVNKAYDAIRSTGIPRARVIEAQRARQARQHPELRYADGTTARAYKDD